MTIKEIAKLAGVSISTVSKIVNNKDDNINIETRNHVLKIVKEYNYMPYASAKTASTAKTFLLGVLLKSTHQTGMMLHGIMETAQKNGYRILICDSQDSKTEELKNITALTKNKVDGVIWEPVNETSTQYAHYFTNQDISICYIDSMFVKHSYCIDFIQMGYHATLTLLNLNHTQIACLTKEDSFRSQMVLEGFKKCLFDYQIPYMDKMKLIASNTDFYTKILACKFTGIVSTHFASSLALCEQINKMHYKIPDELSLVTLRDDSRETIPFPELSSIKIPYREFGSYVCQKLIHKCEKRIEPFMNFVAECPLENTLSLDVPYSLRPGKIVVVGSINIDVTLNVDELPKPGKTVSTTKHSVCAGGKGINQAVGVAKLDYDVALIGRVGNDYDATIIYNTIEENHIDIQGVYRDTKADTGKAYIHLQKDGESTISILAGANQRLTPADIREQQRLFENAGFCLLQTEVPQDAVEEAARIAKEYGVQTILKPAALTTIRDSLLEKIDYFIPNQVETLALCPTLTTFKERADYFLKKGVKTVIITLGQDGCYVQTKEYAKNYPAILSITADATGAADAFIAALAVYLSSGYTLDKSIRIASYAASFCVGRQGVVPALIDRNTLETYVKRFEADLI